MKAIFFFTKLKETEKNKKQLISRMDRIGIKGNHKLEWNGMEWNSIPFLLVLVVVVVVVHFVLLLIICIVL